MKTETLFSRKSDEWETPQDLFDTLNEEFHFDLDPCATVQNRKCWDYITAHQDGLKADWGGCRVYCNPPYSHVSEWVEKCYREGHKDHTLVVVLLPARTGTRWFHDYVQHRAEVRFIRGRLRFGESKNSAPFDSMLVIFRGPGVK